MVGVWFSASNELLERPAKCNTSKSSTTSITGPILWRVKFDAGITRDLVLYQHPSSANTNYSDLELAASLVQHDIVAHHFNVRERTIMSGSDNTPTIA
jgi:hypothetical protein